MNGPTDYAKRILGALQPQRNASRRSVPHIYTGTVPFEVKQKRRAKNKIAKASRKANRGKR